MCAVRRPQQTGASKQNSMGDNTVLSRNRCLQAKTETHTQTQALCQAKQGRERRLVVEGITLKEVYAFQLSSSVLQPQLPPLAVTAPSVPSIQVVLLSVQQFQLGELIKTTIQHKRVGFFQRIPFTLHFCLSSAVCMGFVCGIPSSDFGCRVEPKKTTV